MSNLAYKCLMEINKLIGSNFTDCFHCLRLVLRHDKVEYVLDKPIDVIPDKESLEFATFDVKAHQKHIDNASDAQCVMLSSMSLELQGQHEHMLPYEMLKHLESFYASQAQTMEYEILRDLFKCKLHDASKVSEHVLKMIGLIERLASIGTVLLANVSTNLILPSLPTSFENFIVNFNMNNTKIGRPELHNRLKTYESSTAKVKSELMGLSDCRKMRSGEVDLRVGNGARVAAERVGTY
ncbi:uncharacterized protein LOC121810638 [Salvia splendens]|uniref:uncharacterized protein LOC121810638 n=1 Tax=Salvia splendens TaxID=180675 RepID=UPI001C271322|nr:uncharacterized protein LOC121810638 [Salvia splendens]